MPTSGRIDKRSLLDSKDNDEMDQKNDEHEGQSGTTSQPSRPPTFSNALPAFRPGAQPTASLPGQLKGKGKRQASNSPYPDSPSLALHRKRTKPDLKISPETANIRFSPAQSSPADTTPKVPEDASNAATTSFGLGIEGLAYLNAPNTSSAGSASPDKGKGPMTALASSFGHLFQDANDVKKEEQSDEDGKPADTRLGGAEDKQAGETTLADAKMSGADENEPYDNIMASLEEAEPDKVPKDVDIGSPTPPSSPVLQAHRQRQPQKGKQPLRFSMGEAIMSQNDILLNVCNFLGLKDFVNFYCVSKRFYVLVNSHYTTHIKQLARNYAPVASAIFPYQLYKRTCIQDPVLRTRPIHAGDPPPSAATAATDSNKDENDSSTNARDNNNKKNNDGVIRTVPGLKWVLMCAYREAIVHDILLCLALEGHRFPGPIPGSVLRIWALLDQPFNGARAALVRDERLWPNRDVFLGLMFCMKLDMRFADPLLGGGECVLRRLLLGQKSLVVLWEALRGLTARTRAEVLAMVLEWDGKVPFDGDELVSEGETLMGVPVEKVGSLSREGWRQDGDYLLRPDELLMREAIRRGLHIHRCFLDYMLWGYIDWTWLKAIEVPDLERLELEDRRRRGGGDVGGSRTGEQGERKISSGSFRDMTKASGVS